MFFDINFARVNGVVAVVRVTASDGGKSEHFPDVISGSKVAAPMPERVRSSDLERASEVTPVKSNLRGAIRDALIRKNQRFHSME